MTTALLETLATVEIPLAQHSHLIGASLEGQEGAPATVRLNGAVPTYPVTLGSADVLRVERAAGEVVTRLYGTLAAGGVAGGLDRSPAGYLVRAGTLSPAWPDQTMFENLQAQVGAAAGFPGYVTLSDNPVTGHSVAGTQGTVQALGAVLGIGPGGQAVTVVGASLPAAVTLEQIGSVQVERAGQVLDVGQGLTAFQDGATTYLSVTRPLTIPPGADLVVRFTQSVQVRTWGQTSGAPSNAYRTGYLDAQGQVVDAVLNAELLLTLGRQAYGSLPADGMRVVPAPSELRPGDFEVVAALGAAPRLRLRHGDTVYSLSMTAEP